MKQIKTSIILLIFISTLYSCSNEQRSATSTLNSQNASLDVNDNNSKDVSESLTTKTFGNYSFSLITIEPETRAEQFAKVGTPEYQKELKNQKLNTVYRLRISSLEGPNLIEVNHEKYPTRQKRITYFMNELSKNISLTTKTDTLNPILSHFEHPNSMLNHIDIMLSFDIAHEMNKDKMIIEDNYLNIGRIKLKA